MIPLGVCVLPAFMLLGVIPLLVTVLSSTFGKF
jgi:tight adherence protein B